MIINWKNIGNEYFLTQLRRYVGNIKTYIFIRRDLRPWEGCFKSVPYVVIQHPAVRFFYFRKKKSCSNVIKRLKNFSFSFSFFQKVTWHGLGHVTLMILRVPTLRKQQGTTTNPQSSLGLKNHLMFEQASPKKVSKFLLWRVQCEMPYYQINFISFISIYFNYILAK